MKEEVLKPSQLMRKAANVLINQLHQRKFERTGCCAALSIANKKLQPKTPYWNLDEKAVKRAHQLFSSLFKPKNKSKYCYWFGANLANSYSPDTRKEVQEHRIMALLLTAEMAESVGE